MKHITRNEFLQTSAVLLATLVGGSSFDTKAKKPLLSFSTLGCPDWSFGTIVDFAAKHQYTGLELRGIKRELDLTKCPEFSTQNIAATMALMKEKGLRFVDLGSSATMHFSDPAQREKNMTEGKKFIDLAQQINCPYIRVFPNNFPKDQDKNTTMDLIIKGLQQLGDHAKGSNVSVLIETHGDLVNTEDIVKVMSSAANEHVGIIWDVTNMWTVTKDPPAQVYDKIKTYIRHTHLKDAKLVDEKIQYTFMGQGEVPIFEAVDLLAKGGYKGYYSFEWEKLWHPELAEPNMALADYPKAMMQHFK